MIVEKQGKKGESERGGTRKKKYTGCKKKKQLPVIL